MAVTVYWILFPAILTSFFALSSPNQPDFDRFLGELEEEKLTNACANSALKESIQKLQAKWSLYLKEREEWIQDMDDKIQYLQSALSNLKDDSPHADERLETLEEEVRLLWAASRKNNFDLHALEVQAQYAEDQLALGTSRAKKMVEIVTEQWFQIQHLEQALEIAKIRALEVQRQSSMRCTFLKGKLKLDIGFFQIFFYGFSSMIFLRSIFQGSLGNLGVDLTWLHSSLKLWNSLKVFFSFAKKYHHEFQAFIKKEMVKNEFTAALANEELVFYLASALLIFPLLSAWMLLSSLHS
ncbi:hypothetical protein SLE2022_011500 [Rubroshorea leprosula]